MWGRQSLSFGEEGKSKENHDNNNQYLYFGEGKSKENHDNNN